MFLILAGWPYVVTGLPMPKLFGASARVRIHKMGIMDELIVYQRAEETTVQFQWPNRAGYCEATKLGETSALQHETPSMPHGAAFRLLILA